MAVLSKKILIAVFNEIPSEIIDGINTIFTLNVIPLLDSEQVILNGLIQTPGIGKDYTISGNTITFSIAPKTGYEVKISYYK